MSCALYTHLTGLVGSMHSDNGGDKGQSIAEYCGIRRQACDLGEETLETQEDGIS